MGYTVLGDYWPKPHDPTQCPPCIKKQQWCPKKLCHCEPKDYADVLDQLLEDDRSCSVTPGSIWKVDRHQDKDVLSRTLSIRFNDGYRGKFQMTLQPAVFCI